MRAVASLCKAGRLDLANGSRRSTRSPADEKEPS